MTTSTITRGCSDSLLTTSPLQLVNIRAFGIRFVIFYNIFFSISLPLSIAKQCISLVISAALSLNLSILFWKEATERLRLDVDSCWAIFLKENPVRVFMFFSDRTFSAWLYSSFAKCTSASCLNFLLATTSLLRNDILSRSNAQSLVPVLFLCNLLWTAPDILAYSLSVFLGLFLIRLRVPPAPYGPWNEWSGMGMKKSYYFSLAVFKCKRNGSSCTSWAIDMLTCLDSKGVEVYGPSPVLCMYHWPISGRASWESSNESPRFLFHKTCLKGTFWD